MLVLGNWTVAAGGVIRKAITGLCWVSAKILALLLYCQKPLQQRPISARNLASPVQEEVLLVK